MRRMHRSAHPSIAGREAVMAELTDIVRRLVEVCTLVDGSAEVLAAATSSLAAVVRDLEAVVPDLPHPRFARSGDGPAAPDLGDAMPYDVVVGRCNPLAPPVVMEAGHRAVGHCRFGRAYEGAPGWVHGAALAGAFDIVLTAANQLAGAAGPTVSLRIRFRRPTLLHEECRFEAEVLRQSARRVVSAGRLVQAGRVTVDAEGEFAVVDPETLRSGRPGGGAIGGTAS